METIEIQEETSTEINGEKRTANDLESIEWGTPSNGGKRKVYFNIREDTEIEIQGMIDVMNRLATYSNR